MAAVTDENSTSTPPVSGVASTSPSLCVFCNEGADDRVLGDLLTADGISAHHFCLVN